MVKTQVKGSRIPPNCLANTNIRTGETIAPEYQQGKLGEKQNCRKTAPEKIWWLNYKGKKANT